VPKICDCDVSCLTMPSLAMLQCVIDDVFIEFGVVGEFSPLIVDYMWSDIVVGVHCPPLLMSLELGYQMGKLHYSKMIITGCDRWRCGWQSEPSLTWPPNHIRVRYSPQPPWDPSQC
jgi:hypothetical protein